MGISHFGCFSAVVLAENDVTDIMGGVNIEPCDDILETRSPSFSKTFAGLLKSVDKLLLGPKCDFQVNSSLEEVVGGSARHVWLSSPAIEKMKRKCKMMMVGLSSSSGKCRNLGAGSNWRNEYFKASSSSIIEACKGSN